MYSLENNLPQRELVYSNKFETAGFGGVGSGKSLGGIIRAFFQIWGFPENVFLIGRKHATSLRDTTQKDFLDYVRHMNGGTLKPGPVVESWNKVEKDLVLRQGSLVVFRHLDEIERILSMNLGGVLIDQVEEIPYETYKQIKGRLRLWGPERVTAWGKKWGKWGTKFWGKPVKPRHFLTAIGNPHPGWAKLYFKERKDPDSGDFITSNDMFRYVHLPTSANKVHLAKEFLRSLENQPEGWKKRFMEGDWGAFEGQIYKDLSHKVHVCKPFEIPEHWDRYVGLDHGFTNPTVCLCCAVDEDGNHFYYKEYYKTDEIVRVHAKNIRQMLADEPVPRSKSGELRIIGDPSMAGAGKGIVPHGAIEEYADHGILIEPANNRVHEGIMQVASMLRVDPTHRHPLTDELGAPRLYFFDNVIQTFHEMVGYAWKDADKTGTKSEEPLKKDDHGPDVVRYVEMQIVKTSKKLYPKKKALDNYDSWLQKELTKVEPIQGGMVRYGE